MVFIVGGGEGGGGGNRRKGQGDPLSQAQEFQRGELRKKISKDMVKNKPLAKKTDRGEGHRLNRNGRTILNGPPKKKKKNVQGPS